jgi:hypothetical protein
MAEEKKEEGKKGEGKKEIEVSTTEEIKRGVFSNQAVVNHSPEEFVIDFLYRSPSGGTLSSRVILTPGHYKRLVKGMTENLRKYEERFGEIPEKLKDTSSN